MSDFGTRLIRGTASAGNHRLESLWTRLSGDYPNSTMVVPIEQVRVFMAELYAAIETAEQWAAAEIDADVPDPLTFSEDYRRGWHARGGLDNRG
jgi:hypothetical protein